MRSFLKSAILLFALFFLMPGAAFSKLVEYDLTIEQQPVTIEGRNSSGMTINGAIPGPVLYFTEGDTARIRVHNRMDVDTSIHWHGLLVPPGMDGVPYISFPPISPGKTFVYEFPIRQSGTYWYHSHTHLQEQRGVYGGIVIRPGTMDMKADQDHVVLLSDWTTENPDTVLRTLKRGSEWYSLQKGSSQSIMGAARQGELGAYIKRELQRMPPMDIADVAYDYFLANGRPESFLAADPGEQIRLRIINGSATTYFYLEFAGGSMEIVSADGQAVQPISQKRFLIGVAETYDVLVTLPKKGAFELRATAHDGSGHSSVWIGSGDRVAAADIPRPDLYRGMEHGSAGSLFALTPQGVMGMPDKKVEAGEFDSPGMAGMTDMAHGEMSHNAMPEDSHPNPMDNSMAHKTMDPDSMNGKGMHQNLVPKDPTQKGVMSMDNHTMEKESAAGMGETRMGKDEMKPEGIHDSGSSPPKSGKAFTWDFGLLVPDVASSDRLAPDGTSSERPWPPYAMLKAKASTALPKGMPVREIRLTLDGDMERYVWFLNNRALSESDVIPIKEGEAVRFIMINRTMMHHPMHLHGHFFRVINGQGDFAPLKHTVDVAPMSTTVIEFNANEVGDWFFHCHLLYHMKSGMARKIHYLDFKAPEDVSAISQNLFKDPWYAWGEADVLSHYTEGSLKLANTRNTLELEWEAGWENVEDTHWEGTLTLDRYINRFFSLFGGGFMEGENSEEKDTKGIFGIHYLLPLSIESKSWIDTEGEARFMLKREFELTPRISLKPEFQYDTKEDWETSVGMSYMLHKNVSLTVLWHSEYDWGGGISIRF